MTLEDLAGASGVSARAISDMERGYSRAPQQRTMAAIANALDLPATDRQVLLDAARSGRTRGATGSAEMPRTVADFAGRLPELDQLDRHAAAQAQLHFDGHPSVIYLQADEARIEAVRAVLPPTIDPADPAQALVSRPTDALFAKRATQTAYQGLFLGLAGVALLVGGLGVANTMVVSVLERRREIGLRRALGAHRGQIRLQFLTESVLLALLGGLAGLYLGALGTAAYALYQHWPMVVPPAVVAGGTAATLLVGVAAGAYPAVRAARLTPTEALAAP